MTDHDPQLRQVGLKLAAEDIPELMGLLSDFVLAHDVQLEFTGAIPAAASDDSNEKNERRYNPDRIVWMYDPSRQAEVAVVGEKQLIDFKKTNKSGHRLKAFVGAIFREKLFISLNADTRLDKDRAPTAVQMERYAVFGEGERGRIQALRADTMSEFVVQLQTGAMIIQRVGPSSIELLAQYAEDLYLPSTGEHTKNPLVFC